MILQKWFFKTDSTCLHRLFFHLYNFCNLQRYFGQIECQKSSKQTFEHNHNTHCEGIYRRTYPNGWGANVWEFK